MNQIAVSIASGEAGRIKLLEAALKGDNRFKPLQIAADLPVDLRFEIDGKRLNMELKLPRDWVGSVLGGHLQEQVLHIRELLEDGCIVILGNLEAIYEAIRDSATGRGIKQSEIHHVIASTHARCKSFRKRSMLNGVPVFFKGDDSGFFDSNDQWADLLELAVDYLTDGDMMGFRQRPADGERELLAASILFHGDGIGPGVLKPVMQDYTLRLVPKVDPARPVCEMAGIGKKRAAVIDKRISMIYGMVPA
jgi:hypothetical protein